MKPINSIKIHQPFNANHKSHNQEDRQGPNTHSGALWKDSDSIPSKGSNRSSIPKAYR